MDPDSYRARRDEAVRLRTEGHTLEQIGLRLGVTKARVGQILKAEARRASKPPSPPERPLILSDHAVRHLFLSLGHMAMTVRLWNTLWRAGFCSAHNWGRLGDLCTLDRKQLKAIKGLGAKSLRELEEELERHELRLGLRIPAWPEAVQGVMSGGPREIESRDIAALRGALGIPARFE